MLTKSITKIVQEIVLDSERPAKEIALEVRKPYPTLLREVNPYDKGAKLGVETLMLIMKVTGDCEPLRHMARELGFRLVPLENEPGRAVEKSRGGARDRDRPRELRI